jgi:glutathione-regulated potassium-efflux system ancillary protein KefG
MAGGAWRRERHFGYSRGVTQAPGAQVLILFAHPALERSRINRRLAAAVQALPGVTFHDLYEHYPDFDIDVKREQQVMEAHPVVVMQHPFYWYSTPALLKQWQDLVLEHHWAYGAGGTKLQGKILLSAITSGGGEASYTREGFHGRTVLELLAPVAQTARLCGMHYPPPFIAHGTHGMPDAEVQRHTRDYVRLIEALRDRRVDLDAARALPRINQDLDAVIRDRRDTGEA